VTDIGFIGLRRTGVRETRQFSGRKVMKPFSELNRTTVLVLYWGLFGGGGNCGMGKAVVRSLRDGFEHCRIAGKRKDGVPGIAQVVSRWDAGAIVAESAHTSSEPCLAGSAETLVTAWGKVMSYPSGGRDRAADSRYES
jgi:hypothetical protein